MELSIKQEIGKHMIESFMGRELSDVEFSIVIKSEYGKYFDDPSLLRNAPRYVYEKIKTLVMTSDRVSVFYASEQLRHDRAGSTLGGNNVR